MKIGAAAFPAALWNDSWGMVETDERPRIVPASMTSRYGTLRPAGTPAERETFYLTAAIDYPMGRPHLGNAFEKIGADVQARYRRMQGYETRFLLGSDEHTVLIPRYAAAANTPTDAFVQQRADIMRDAWSALQVSPDLFIQTSDPRHEVGCRQFVQRLFESGFLYDKAHETLYCENCEEFKRVSDLRGGFCESHPTVRAILVRETNYFFRLGSLREPLLALYRSHPELVRPAPVQADIVASITAGLDDIAVTRLHSGWGIRAPFDPGQTIYVWVDALLSYLTAAGYGHDDAAFRRWWPADLQIIGRDIAGFHGILWPALLLAAGLEPPRHIEVHGLMLHHGLKMSKTMGNVVDALELADRFGADALRFFLMRECPFREDGDYTHERFADVYRREIAGQLGGLYDTTVAMCRQSADSPMSVPASQNAVLDWSILPSLVRELHTRFDRCEYHLALASIVERVVAPAASHAGSARRSRAAAGVRSGSQPAELIQALRVIAILLKPFIPVTAERIYATFGFRAAFDDLRLEDAIARDYPASDPWSAVMRLGGQTPLFPALPPAG